MRLTVQSYPSPFKKDGELVNGWKVSVNGHIYEYKEQIDQKEAIKRAVAGHLSF